MMNKSNLMAFLIAGSKPYLSFIRKRKIMNKEKVAKGDELFKHKNFNEKTENLKETINVGK